MYRLEIDQSNRLDESGDTFIALSNDISYVVKVSSRTKDAARRRLRQLGKSKKRIEPVLWAACAFLLLEDHLKEIERHADVIVIDNEFYGHEADVKATLLRYIRKHYGRFPEHRIRIASIGKGSPAHHVAWLSRRRRQADRSVTLRELLRLLQ